MRFFEANASWLALVALTASASAQAWLDTPRVLEEPGFDIRGIADVDGDGDEDLVVVETASDGWTVRTFHVLFRTAADEYAAGPTTTIPLPHGHHFQLGDLTGDGLPELVFGVEGDDPGYRLYRNVGGGNFAAPSVLPVVGFYSAPMAFGDREGDGDQDLAAIEDDPVSFVRLRWWSWDGSTLVPSGSVSTPDYAFWVRAVDLTGEGRSDLVAGSYYGPNIAVAETLPDGELSSFSTVPTFNNPSSGFIASGGDLDGDGDEDLLAMWKFLDRSLGYHVWILGVIDNLGGGQLAVGAEQELEHQSSEEIEGGLLVDWDLDGDLDFLTGPKRLRMLRNDGTGRFRLSDVVNMPSDANGGGTADLNEDGFPDFAGGRVIFYGDGTLEKQHQDPPRGQHAVDLEADGDIDLVGLDSMISSIAKEWINDGTGSFLEVDQVVAPPPGSRFVDYTALGDFDGDGLVDYLVERRLDSYPFFPFQDTRLLRGKIDRGFVDAGRAGAPGVHVGVYDAFDMSPGDVDGDSDLDVLTRDGWWENEGAGFFASFHGAWSGLPRAAADVDGDHDLDLLTRTQAGATTSLALQRNLGDGTFAAEPLVSESVAGDLSRSAYLVDIDRDGDPEVLISTTAPVPRVLIFDNVGGSFAGPQELPGQYTAQEVLAFTDVDGDGKLDIIGATASTYPGGPWLVWRRAGIGFDPPREYFGPWFWQSVDVDQDGDIDMVADRVVRTRLFEGRGDGLARQYGRGTSGSGNVAPVLGAVGPIRPGSRGAALRISRALGGSLAVVRGGTGPAHAALKSSPALSLLIRGRLRYVPPLLGRTHRATDDGATGLRLAPVQTTLSSTDLWLQAFVVDPGAPRGISSTNGLDLVLGSAEHHARRR